jgi:hypothetical protein
VAEIHLRALTLYAVVPGDEAVRIDRRVCRVVQCDECLAAVVGRWPLAANDTQAALSRAALRHDRIVASALRSFSAIVPFRFGVTFGTDGEIVDLVRQNTNAVRNQLRRFKGRVEMGLKTLIFDAASSPPGDRPKIPTSLDLVRALAPRPEDRREHLTQSARGMTLDGCYLIPRFAESDFWRALDDVRRAAPDRPLLGSGPWAPYSFCDGSPLRPAGQGESELPVIDGGQHGL